jgi:hypothetical protein
MRQQGGSSYAIIQNREDIENLVKELIVRV